MLADIITRFLKKSWSNHFFASFHQRNSILSITANRQAQKASQNRGRRGKSEIVSMLISNHRSKQKIPKKKKNDKPETESRLTA